jgi:hypothetical protein
MKRYILYVNIYMKNEGMKRFIIEIKKRAKKNP